MSSCGGPRLRVLMHRPRAALERLLAAPSPPGDDWFAWGALKLFADGTLGSRTASMLDPYDGTEERGMTLIPPDELKGLVGRSVRGGLSVAIHAIGDHAVRGRARRLRVLRPRARSASPSAPHRARPAGGRPGPQALRRARSRREHAAPALRHRSTTGGAPVAAARDALRIRGARCSTPAHRSRSDPDAPVEPPSPSLGLHAAVTREATDRSR